MTIGIISRAYLHQHMRALVDL